MSCFPSILCAFSSLFGSESFIASSSPSPSAHKTTDQVDVAYQSSLQIGADYTHLFLEPHGHSSSDGNMYGLQGLYEYFSNSHFYAGVKLAWKQGDVDGSSEKRSILYIDTQERFGYTASLNTINVSWTFFSGLGYRYLGQHLKNGLELSFNYSEFYVPVGVLMDYKVSSWFDCHLNFIWMPQVFSTVWIDPLAGANWTITQQVGNFMVEMPFDFTLTKNQRWHLMITPFYEYWQDGHSTAKAPSGLALGLPGNTYQFCGVNVNFDYCF